MGKGDKVVCINDENFDPRVYDYITYFPVEGTTYTIRDVVNYPTMGRSGYLLEEIINPPVNWKDMGTFEPTFNTNRFVPLEEYKGEKEEVGELLQELGLPMESVPKVEEMI